VLELGLGLRLGQELGLGLGVMGSGLVHNKRYTYGVFSQYNVCPTTKEKACFFIPQKKGGLDLHGEHDYLEAKEGYNLGQ
jgi:hypothetical protein